MVQEILDKLDTIIDEPVQTCGNFLGRALQAMEDDSAKDAIRHFEESVKNAVKGKYS